MTNSPNHKNAIDPTVPTQSLRGKLMFAASAGILALVAPSGCYGMRSEAQTNMLPDGCIDDPATDSDNNDDRQANDGETVDCFVGPNDGPIDPLSTTVADLTVRIGAQNSTPLSAMTRPRVTSSPNIKAGPALRSSSNRLGGPTNPTTKSAAETHSAALFLLTSP